MTEQQAEQAAQAAPAQAASTEQPARTAEQVEAEWQSRHTALGRQHAAEVQALKDQLATAQTGQQAATQTSEQAGSEVEALKRQLAQAEQANKQQAQDFSAQLRATKYPFAAEALDPQVLAAMDEAKLAGLNARLAPVRATVPVDPSTPQRDSAVPKPTAEKSVAELQADLARYAPEFAASIETRE